MAGIVLKVVDEDGAPFLQPDEIITVSTFVPGTTREAGASWQIPSLLAGGITETEIVLKSNTSTGAGYVRLSPVDEDGAPLLTSYNENVTVSTPVDVTAPTYSVPPSATGVSIYGANFPATLSENGRRYGVAVPVSSGQPSKTQIKNGQTAQGSAAYSSGFKNVASGVSDSLPIFNVTVDSAGIKVTAFDYYEYAEDGVGLTSGIVSVLGVVIDAPATFTGNTSGSVNTGLHQVTLGPFVDAVDAIDSSSQLRYAALIDSSPAPIEVFTGAPGQTTLTFDPGTEGNGTHDWMVRSINTRNLMDQNTSKVNLTLPASGGIYTGSTGVMRNMSNIPPLDGTQIKYSIYNNGDTNSPHTQLPNFGPIDDVTANGKLDLSYSVAGTHYVRVTDPVGEETWSGFVVFA